MVRSNGARLVYSFTKRSVGSKFNNGAPNLLDESLRLGNRQISGICSSSWSSQYGNSVNVKYKDGVWSGNWGAKRLFHATGSKFMSGRDYYEVLGVRESASSSELKQAFYAIAKKLHPDVNRDDPDAEKKFQEVQKAYEVLKDDEKRSIYDQVGHESFEQSTAGGGSGGPYGNPFEDIFRGGEVNDFFKDLFTQKEFGGPDAKVSLELSFMEAIQGCHKTVSFQTALKCDTCGGKGVPPGTKPQTCKACKGSGVTVMQKGLLQLQYTCSMCDGTGKIVKSFCKSCKGYRVVKGLKTVNIQVVGGVTDGETTKFFRNGGADPEGNQHGDLYVTYKVQEDPVFRREGPHIHVDTVLSISQAILGCTIQVPTLTGNVALKVRAGAQHGEKVVLKKKGIKTRGSTSFSDQYVHLNLSIPTTLTQRQRALIEEFAKEEQGDYEKGAAVAGASG